MTVDAALGVVPRSMVAVLVAVAATPDGPCVLERREIPLVIAGLPDQAYHAAAGLPPPDAERIVRRWADAAATAMTLGMLEAVRALAVVPARVVAVGVAAEVRTVPPLATVLRSHPLQHAAEGQLSREAVAEAAARAELPVRYLSPRGRRHAELQDQANALGRGLGPPWRAQQKLAAAAALDALSGAR